MVGVRNVKERDWDKEKKDVEKRRRYGKQTKQDEKRNRRKEK